MQFISRYNTSFMAFVYKKYNHIFRSFEFYSEHLLKNCPDKYYETLEGDLKEYCDWQVERRVNYVSKDKTTDTRAQSGETRPGENNPGKI